MSNELILAISTTFLAIFTLVLAIFTYYLYSEARKTREYHMVLNRPELSVTFQPSKKFIQRINIHIKNIGRSPIYNLELEKVEGDVTSFDGKEISELEYLKKINYLGPNQEIVQHFFNFIGSKLKPEEIKFDLFFKYENEKRNIYRKKFPIDFGQFRGMSQLGEEPLYKISKNIEKIKNDIHHLSTGFKKLQVITQTKKEKQAEER
ncbi:MAG: hypothetical protein ACOCUU_02440 [Nanoarchaeota archaeon]